MGLRHIPKFSNLLLRIFLGHDEYLEKSGDLEESFLDLQKDAGTAGARIWHSLQVLKIVSMSVKNTLCWRLVMFVSNLKIAARNVRKNKGTSFINILGLAVGIACSLLILIYVYDEWRFDRFHVDGHRIYRIISNGLFIDYPIHQTGTPFILAKTLREEYPEDLTVTQLNPYNAKITIENQIFILEKILIADSFFFRVFTFPAIHGETGSSLDEPFAVVLTRSAAKRYFGRTDVSGQVLRIDDQDFSVTAVVEDVPRHSHFSFDAVLSMTSNPNYQGKLGWLNNNYTTYIHLTKNTSSSVIQQKLDALSEKHVQPMISKMENNWWKYRMEPMLSIHLGSDLNAPYGANGKREYVTIFSIVAVLILLIACVNYVNLATAQALKRIKEIGVRKVAGSSRRQLIGQFLTESILVSMIGTALAMVLVHMFLPPLRPIAGRELEVHYFNNPFVIPCMFLFALLLGLASGLYPAFTLSAFKPVSVLKGSLKNSRGKSLLRSGLVIFQYSISIFLLISTLVIYRQLKYIQNSDLGFNQEQVLVVRNADLLGSQKEAFKAAILSSPNIRNVSGSSHLPGQGLSNFSISIQGNDKLTLDFCICDEHFLETMEMQLSEGRFFSSEFSTDTSALVLNEEAVRMFGWDNPIGQTVVLWGRIPLRVIGMVKNFHYESLHTKIDKMGLALFSSQFRNSERYVSARMVPNDIPGTVEFVRKTWKTFAPDFPFEYTFLDETFDRLYQNELRTRTLAVVFSSLAVFISSLGMFGLASFASRQRTKEMGIRKVLGATAFGLASLFSRAFLSRVFLANCITWPAAYFLISKWLESFAYRTTLKFWIFLVSGLLAMGIALLTVTFHALRTAAVNPVKSLRYE